MSRRISALLAVLAVVAAVPMAGCTRIETGEVGMRVNFDRTIDPTELQPGTWNQTVFGALNLSVVKVRNILPNAQIVQAATEYVRAQNELKIKATQVEIARKESERMAALAANSEKPVAYMDAQARLTSAKA